MKRLLNKHACLIHSKIYLKCKIVWDRLEWFLEFCCIFPDMRAATSDLIFAVAVNFTSDYQIEVNSDCGFSYSFSLRTTSKVFEKRTILSTLLTPLQVSK